MRIDHLAFVFPYWESPDMLREQVRHWNLWSPEALAKTTFIVVDDCSNERPIDVALLARQGMDIRAFRVTKKAVWNWRAPKNIAMHEAPDGWALNTDIDHVLPAAEADRLFDTEVDPHRVYWFTRLHARSLSPNKRHSSTWLVTREMFWRIGGYDESFVGTQMGWRGEMPARIEKLAGPFTILPVHVLRYDSDLIADSTAKLPRRDDGPEAEAAEQAIVDRIRATWTGVKTMTFPYERLL